MFGFMCLVPEAEHTRTHETHKQLHPFKLRYGHTLHACIIDKKKQDNCLIMSTVICTMCQTCCGKLQIRQKIQIDRLGDFLCMQIFIAFYNCITDNTLIYNMCQICCRENYRKHRKYKMTVWGICLCI